MKKILLFTSIILLAFSVKVHAQHPTNLQVTNITVNTAELSWDQNPCSGLVFLRYRKVGGLWTTIGSPTPGVSTPYTLTGLDYSTTYEWAVKCKGLLGWANEISFTTINPPTITNVNITDTIKCRDGLGEISIEINQSTTPTTQLELLIGYYPTSGWSSTFLYYQTSVPVVSNSTITISGLPANDYIIRLIDTTLYTLPEPTGNGTDWSGTSLNGVYDEYSTIISLVQPDSLLATTSVIADNLCFGDSIAQERLIIQGGTMPYAYAINGGITQALPTGISTTDFIALSADTYDIVVTDANTCPILNANISPNTIFFTITEPSEIIGNGFVSSDYNGYDVACNGDSTGEITASTSNNYTVQTVGSTFSPSNITINLGDTVTFINTGGNHNVNGTTSTFTSNPASFGNSVSTGWTFIHVFTVAGAYDYQCNLHPGMTGTINVNSNGAGTDPMTYSLDGINFSTNPIFPDLIAGAYTLIYQDANSCRDTQVVNINEPISLSGTASITDSVDCYGENSGEITFLVDSVQVGVLGYQYSINNGANYQASEIFTNLLGDTTYNVMIEDTNGCQFTSAFYLPEPAEIIYSTTLSNHNGNGYEVSCDGASDGMIDFTSTTGGLAPYQYSIDGGTTFDPASNYSSLPSNTFNIQVKDTRDCITPLSSILLEDPGVFSLLYLITTDIDCPGNCNGVISINPSNGVGQILYDINGGTQQNSPSFSGLCGDITIGPYTLNAVDENFCSAIQIISLPEPTAFVYSKSSIDEYCSLANGQASITVTSGGTGDYSYAWNTNPIQDSAVATNIAGGTYTVTVTDSNSCLLSESIIVASNSGFPLSLSSVSPCLGDSSGQATVSPAGSPPYSYQWSNIIGIMPGETSAILSNMPIGTYSVQVIDSTACSVSGSVDILPPNSIVVDSIVVINSGCYGIDDAQIEMFASGGQQPYFYSIDNGLNLQTDPVFDSLASNIYTLYAIDANNCFDDTVITLSPPDLLEIDSTVFTHISCFGSNNGAVQDIQFVGGTGPFEFSIDGGVLQPYMAFSGLDPGTHTVEVLDANNCVSQDYIIINEPTLFEVAITPSDWNNYQIMCNDDSSGYVDITAWGGTTPYLTDSTTFWSTTTIDSLWAGIHTFIVEDANGCDYTETIMFNEPNPIQHNFITNHVTCVAWDNGSVTDSVYGGVGSATTYSYLWSTGETTYSLDNLSVDTLTITVTDENGCTDTDSVIINATNAFGAIQGTIIDVGCFDDCDGELSVIASGGIPFTGTTPYTYLWNDYLGQNTATAVGLCVDSISLSTVYDCIVTDAAGCVDTVSLTLEQPAELQVQVDISPPLSPISCNGLSDGKLRAVVTGGESPYDYSWSTGATGTGGFNDIFNLSAGLYKVTVEDANTCRDTFEVYLNEPTPVEISIEEFDIACFGDDDGYVEVLGSGGTSFEATYSYTLYLNGMQVDNVVDYEAGSILQNPYEFTNLIPGNYYVIVEDRNNCQETSLSVEITEPFAPLTLLVDTVDETCLLNDGIIRIFAEGGSQSFNYLIDGNPTLNNSNIIGGNTPGWYAITVIDTRGCEINDVTFIKDYRKIFLPDTISSIDTTICLGQTITIDVDERPDLIYTWDDGIQTGDRIIMPEIILTTGVNSTGYYTLTITDLDGCEQENIVKVTYSLEDPMAASNPGVEYGDSPVILAGDDINLYSENSNGVEYTWQWSNDAITNSDGNITVQGLSESEYYYLEMRDNEGCLGYDSIYVVVGVHPYEAITPNNDDFNDTWTPLDIGSYQDALVQVFNRWGGLVFESQGGENYQEWDGTYNNEGKELPVGTYYYIIDLNTGDEPQTGPVTIIR